MRQKSSNSIKEYVQNINKIINDINGMQNIERTLHDIIKELTDTFGCQTSAIIYIDRSKQEIEILNAHGLSWKFCKAYRKRFVSPKIEDLIWKTEPVYISDAEKESELAGELQLENEFASCYCISLMANHRPLGYLHLDSKQKANFSQDDGLMIQVYAQIISMALIKDILQKELHNPSVEDPETGTIRYPYFSNKLQEAVARAKRLEENLSLVLIDISKFDIVLSSFGIEAAKNVMSELTQLLKTQIRPYDEICRFGTDEIIISLPGNSLDDALACTEKLYQKIKETEFTKQTLKIDVSIGLANLPQNAEEMGGLITATKNALAEAKRHPTSNIVPSQTFFV
jgi:diguanylate cyclase (GGDEF)-like protein